MLFLLILFASYALNIFPNTPCFTNVRVVVREGDFCLEVLHSSTPLCPLTNLEEAVAKLRVMPYKESENAYIIDMGVVATNITKFCHPGRYYNILDSKLIFSLGNEEWLVTRKKSLEILKTTIREGKGPLVSDSMSGKVRRCIWYEPIDGSAKQSVLLYMDTDDWDYYDFNFSPVPGIHDAILTMRVGEHAIFYIPYQLAFGELGSSPIPPRSQVVMEIEIFEAFLRTEEEIAYSVPPQDDD